jgi:hypothetical protein
VKNENSEFIVDPNPFKRILLLVLAMTFVFNFELRAQEEQSQVPENDTVQITQEELSRSEKRDSTKTAKIAAGEGVLSFLGGPGYTPELKLIIAVGGLYTFKTNKEDSLIQRSSVTGSFGVTSTGGQTGKAILTSFWKQDKIRIYWDLWFKNIPEIFGGVVYYNALNIPKSDSTTAYHRLYWQVYPRFLFRIKESLYIGPVLDFNYTKGSEESAGVLADPDYQKFGPKNFNGGAGIILQYDSRDKPVNAYHGTLVQAMGRIYGKYLGGNNNYYLLDIDFRNYQQFGKTEGQTFAWNIRGRFTTKDVPYGEMSMLGSPMDLRGYTWGRFRDESMIYFIGEYRHMFKKRTTGERGKHGFVAWVAGGSILEDVTKIDNFLPNFGAGYRFAAQPRMNVRFDFGFGRDSFGFYFNFTEAF